jgi:hypothetical protein
LKLKGILDFSLGNFLCLRGFAPLGVLQDISKADDNIQRVPRDERLREIGDYLKKGEFLFFPEVILCAALSDSDLVTSDVTLLFNDVQQGQARRAITFGNGLRISSVVSKSRKKDDIRAVRFFQTGTVQFNEGKGAIFSRIDGNHRLAASKDSHVRERVTPFCMVFCQNSTDFRRFSSALFHNINYKQVPLPKEHNLRLILDDIDLFPDDKLKDDPSFGWPYYQARKLYANLDLDLLPNLKPIIETELRSFLVDHFSYFGELDILSGNEQAVKKFKEALARANALFDDWPQLKETRNKGLLAAFLYYLLKSEPAAASFARWVISNHLQFIPESSLPDLHNIFDKVLLSRNHTLFVSMPFGKPKPDEHYAIIERVCKEISATHNLKPPLKVERVDWFHDGTSYAISEKIFDMMSDCGLLLGNLTLCNPNVYHEIGFIMGKAKAEGRDVSDKILLFLDESVSEKMDKYVAFNLAGLKQIRFTSPEVEFARDLRTNIQKFFKLT